MNPHHFLRSLLAVPLVVPLLAFAFGFESGFAFLLVMSLVFGGVPYVVTAAILWFRVGRCNSRSSAVKLILSAPLIFAPLQALFWLLWAWLNPAETTSFTVALGFAAYGLFFGYAYVVLAIVAFVGAVRLGFVSRFPLAESLSGHANVA